jgi:hypothetical protein
MVRQWRIDEDGSGLCTVVETEVYLRSAERVMDREERDAVVDYLAANPLAGDLIPGAGGIRKVRVPLAGRGKRGGGRVLTVFVKGRAVYLLLAYAKNEQANPTPEQARLLRHMVETLF